ncbi:Rab proteins geranylgeranyltransferase component A 1 [Hypsibius exemplaris]|uniref:Rab proteins geranylgeranyltransferase component A n=1 Tax=Hypsibius exemplaris TaxID=2072580 RepID=A0A1W0WLE7_HYPEX|nr:Rab proteins geranylgeranyltransferase component A 1 [Hypsibius exemplaris]
MEDLPTEFDLVVLGTGLPESIIAAAASRVDKAVLQLDSNAFYGRDWAGFRLQDLRDFLRSCEVPAADVDARDVSHLLQAGECLVTLGRPTNSISNVEEVIYIKDDVVETDIAPQPRQERYRRRSERHTSGSSTGSSTGPSPVNTPVDDEAFPLPVGRKQFTFDDVLLQSRKFSLDLAPKLFWTTDAFVNLLKTSNISRYTSFRLVHSVATFLDGRIVEVPFSRSAISNHTDLSALDKRKVMKFMQACMERAANGDANAADLTPARFGDYLDTLKIPILTRRSIVNAIAMCTEDTSTAKAFTRISRFLLACGYYDKSSSPFLFSIFGCGEYPQYFARISAVFGGIQCLNRGVEVFVLDSTKSQVVAVITGASRIACKRLVIPVEYAPVEWLGGGLTERNISRAILITDTSIFPKRPSDVGFMRFAKDGDELGVMLIEASYVTEICPNGYFVVYLWTTAVTTARADLEPYVMKLFEPYRADRTGVAKVLWASFFNHKSIRLATRDADQSNRPTQLPANVKLVSGPSGSLDYEDVLKESEELFAMLYPGEVFLPRVPDPEEIIMDGCDGSTVAASPEEEAATAPSQPEASALIPANDEEGDE